MFDDKLKFGSILAPEDPKLTEAREHLEFIEDGLLCDPCYRNIEGA